MPSLISFENPDLLGNQFQKRISVLEPKKKLKVQETEFVGTDTPVGGRSAQISQQGSTYKDNHPLQQGPLPQIQGAVLSSKPTVNTGFGARSSADVFSKGINWGTDFGIPRGTKMALPEGQWEVKEAFGGARRNGFVGNGDNRGYGNSILARNMMTGETLRLSHLDKVNVRPGQVVKGGQVIGLTGSTGNSTGPHLDVEFRNQRGQLSDVLRSRYAKSFRG